MTTLDPAPLLALLTDRPDGDIAELLGVDRRTIVRWRGGHTGINPKKADTYAHACGLLDYEIWPHLLDQAINENTRTCEGPDCTAMFIATNPGPRRRFCSLLCRKRASYRRNRQARLDRQRARWAADDDYRETKKVIDAAYKRDSRAAARARRTAA